MENETYSVFGGVSPLLRSLVTALLIFLGYMFQLNAKSFFVGIPFLLACIMINWVKGIKIEGETASETKWEEVTPERLQLAHEQALRVKKFRGRNLSIGCLFGLFVLAIFIVPALSKSESVPAWAMMLLYDTLILFGGLILSGGRSAWMAPAFDKKTEVCLRLMGSAIINKDPVLKVIPLLQVGKTARGDFPIDVRLKVKFQGAPDDFLGVQGQISINNVKSTEYPYFYCVIVAQKGFSLLSKATLPEVKNLVIEHQPETDVDVIVIRQKTTKTSGYYTDSGQQEYILENALALARVVLQHK